MNNRNEQDERASGRPPGASAASTYGNPPKPTAEPPAEPIDLDAKAEEEGAFDRSAEPSVEAYTPAGEAAVANAAEPAEVSPWSTLHQTPKSPADLPATGDLRPSDVDELLEGLREITTGGVGYAPPGGGGSTICPACLGKNEIAAAALFRYAIADVGRAGALAASLAFLKSAAGEQLGNAGREIADIKEDLDEVRSTLRSAETVELLRKAAADDGATDLQAPLEGAGENLIPDGVPYSIARIVIGIREVRSITAARMTVTRSLAERLRLLSVQITTSRHPVLGPELTSRLSRADRFVTDAVDSVGSTLAIEAGFLAGLEQLADALLGGQAIDEKQHAADVEFARGLRPDDEPPAEADDLSAGDRHNEAGETDESAEG